MAVSTVSDVGFLLVQSAAEPNDWLPRRLDRIELLDHRTARREARLDIDLPGLRNLVSASGVLGASGAFPTWRNQVLVTVAAVDRKSYVSFDITDDQQRPLARLVRREERTFVAEGLIRTAEHGLGVRLAPDTCAAVRRLITHDVGELDLMNELNASSMGYRLLRNPGFMSLLDLAMTNYFLVIGLDPQTCRQAVFIKTTEIFPRMKRRHLEWLRHPFRGGLGFCDVGFECGSAGDSESYHVEVVAPDDLEIDRASLVLSRKSGQNATETVPDRDRLPNLAHAYVNNCARPRVVGCKFNVSFRHIPTGVLRSAPFSTALTSLTMLIGIWAILVTPLWRISSDLQATTGLLLLFPTIMGALLAHPKSHSLTSRVIFPTRMILSTVSIVPWFAGFALLAHWHGGRMLIAAIIAFCICLCLTLVLISQYVVIWKRSGRVNT